VESVSLLDFLSHDHGTISAGKRKISFSDRRLPPRFSAVLVRHGVYSAIILDQIPLKSPHIKIWRRLHGSCFSAGTHLELGTDFSCFCCNSNVQVLFSINAPMVTNITERFTLQKAALTELNSFPVRNIPLKA
jgi:hypothetical protein